MLLLTIALVIIVFGFVVFFGAPYLPTRKKQIGTALDLLNLSPGQTLLELGSGDGRVLLAAAERGIKCVGYELNPILVVISRIVTWRYRKLVSIKHGNYWSKNWPRADGIYVFLLDKYMLKLDKKIRDQNRPLKLVSFAFRIPNKKLAKKLQGIYLYKY